MEDNKSKIMTTPLPQILDELEDYIRRVEEATKKAEQATIEAHKAAGEAKLAGEKAAGEAARVAEEKISQVQDRLLDNINSLSRELGEVRSLAEEALTTAKLAAEFTGRINRAQVSSLNAAVKAYNEAMAP